jgi:hypothetical protein
MAASHDWYEWHLTPRGWEEGSVYQDSPRKTVEPPADRVETWVADVVIGSTFSKPYRSKKQTWTSSDDEAIRMLREKFGECPDAY